MLTVREAAAADNEALLALVQAGTGGAIDRSPDFFARKRLYEGARTYVAVDEGSVVGVISRALKKIQVGGQEVLAAYLFDLDFHKPAYDEILLECCSQDDAADGAAFSYIQLMTGNPRFCSRFTAYGYSEAARVWLSVLTPTPSGDGSLPPGVRPAVPADYPEIANLLNACYRDYDYYVPVTATELAVMVNSMPGFAAEHLYVAADGDKITACLGCLDYRAIYRFYNHSRGARPGQAGTPLSYHLPWLPQPDAAWNGIVPFPLGYCTTVDELRPLWQVYSRFTADRRTLGLCRFDQDDPLRSLTRYEASPMTNSPMYVLAKPYAGFTFPRSARRVFADQRDL